MTSTCSRSIAHLLVTFSVVPIIAFAEIKPLSRANCLGFVNESITYDRPYMNIFQGSAASRHVPLGNIDPKHVIGAPNNGGFSWRFRAGDQSDPERMTVHGYHTWIVGRYVVTTNTVAVDCSLGEW